ncbi:MAG: sigma-54 dependent transcriptional regulator, partial [Lacipirellulaceae bacterium]
SSEIAIEAMKKGAFDFLTLPIDEPRLELVIEDAAKSRRMMTRKVALDRLLKPDEKADEFVGSCEAMQNVFKEIGRVAAQNVAVLIRGESGTGKELVARAIYQHSDRANKPFLAVNCAALSENLLESELFGHEKGAFTGANEQRIGKFEQCNGGTIFLDEVGDMSPSLQGKVLRLLQQQEFERVGGRETIKTDVRILSATNRPLEEMCREGDYRDDLYYRLNGFAINLPPLRERGDDLQILIEHFLARIAEELDKELTGVAPKARELLLAYDWPGNVRELESLLRKAVLLTPGPVLLETSLPEPILGEDAVALEERETRTSWPVEDAAINAETSISNSTTAEGLLTFFQKRLAAGTSDLYSEVIDRVDRELLTFLLRQTDGNQSEAARILGITRGSLRNKIRSLGIVIDQVVKVEEEPAVDPVPAE